MKREYDFSKGERGKFFQPEAELRLPIYLDTGVQAYLAERAAHTAAPLSEMVNGLLNEAGNPDHRISEVSPYSKIACIGPADSSIICSGRPFTTTLIFL